MHLVNELILSLQVLIKAFAEINRAIILKLFKVDYVREQISIRRIIISAVGSYIALASRHLTIKLYQQFRVNMKPTCQ